MLNDDEDRGGCDCSAAMNGASDHHSSCPRYSAPAPAEKPRDVILATIKRARQAGESQEMLARWIVEDLRKAGYDPEYPTVDAYMAAARAVHWRNAQLRAYGIEPLDLNAPDLPSDPYSYDFGAGEVIAWSYELARVRYWEGGKPTGWGDWGPPQLSFTKPSVPEGSIRNLTALSIGARQPLAVDQVVEWINSDDRTVGEFARAGDAILARVRGVAAELETAGAPS